MEINVILGIKTGLKFSQYKELFKKNEYNIIINHIRINNKIIYNIKKFFFEGSQQNFIFYD